MNEDWQTSAKVAVNLLNMLIPDDAIVLFVGQSPNGIYQTLSEYKFRAYAVPYSGWSNHLNMWYQRDYIEVLRELGLTRDLLKDHRIYLVDYILTGNGIRSFIKMMYRCFGKLDISLIYWSYDGFRFEPEGDLYIRVLLNLSDMMDTEPLRELIYWGDPGMHERTIRRWPPCWETGSCNGAYN